MFLKILGIKIEPCVKKLQGSVAPSTQLESLVPPTPAVDIFVLVQPSSLFTLADQRLLSPSVKPISSFIPFSSVLCRDTLCRAHRPSQARPGQAGARWLNTLNSASRFILICDREQLFTFVSLFSERELTFTFAICYRPSVCLSSVGNVRAPYSGN